MKKSVIGLSLIGIISMPLIILFFKVNGDWLQFYGTYLGIIVSVIMSLYVTKKQSKIDAKNHAIDIYVDNLMKSLDSLKKLESLTHRCKRFINLAESECSKSETQNNDLKLLVSFASNDETEKVISDLENSINRMPSSKKIKLKSSLECLSNSKTLFGEGDNIKKDIDQYVNISKIFVKSYECIKNYVTEQLDYYNTVD